VKPRRIPALACCTSPSDRVLHAPKLGPSLLTKHGNSFVTCVKSAPASHHDNRSACTAWALAARMEEDKSIYPNRSRANERDIHRDSVEG
jgi:hypothetical protein